METIEILGLIAAFCTTISFLPQVIKVVKTKNTRDLSLPMYGILVLGLLLWLIYGIVKMLWPVILANTFTLIFASIILIMKIKHK